MSARRKYKRNTKRFWRLNPGMRLKYIATMAPLYIKYPLSHGHVLNIVKNFT